MVDGGGRDIFGRVICFDSSVALGDVNNVDSVLNAVDGDIVIVFDSLATVDGGGVGGGDGVSGDFGLDASVTVVDGDDSGLGSAVAACRGDVNGVGPSVVAFGGDLIDGRYGCSQPSSTNAAVDEDDDDDDDDAHADTRGRYLYDGLAERL